jgi:Rab-GTPase-TBC domain
MITEDTYKKALSRVSEAEAANRESSPDDETIGISTNLGRIEIDCATIFPALKIFQPGAPLHEDLVKITKAYAFYRSGFAYIQGAHAVAATFVINMTPFTAFVALANALNRPLPMAFLSGDQMAVWFSTVN